MPRGVRLRRLSYAPRGRCEANAILSRRRDAPRTYALAEERPRPWDAPYNTPLLLNRGKTTLLNADPNE
jgi:hypothetical protein